ncbi:hypothetical protein EV426DRAFT_711592 [Tirmania nivea]|nr:hypothetical protein EV426DRAFT_711592 [Tirmania nivea]
MKQLEQQSGQHLEFESVLDIEAEETEAAVGPEQIGAPTQVPTHAIATQTEEPEVRGFGSPSTLRVFLGAVNKRNLRGVITTLSSPLGLKPQTPPQARATDPIPILIERKGGKLYPLYKMRQRAGSARTAAILYWKEKGKKRRARTLVMHGAPTKYKPGTMRTWIEEDNKVVRSLGDKVVDWQGRIVSSLGYLYEKFGRGCTTEDGLRTTGYD